MVHPQEPRQRLTARIVWLLGLLFTIVGLVIIGLHLKQASPPGPHHAVSARPAMIQSLLYLLIILVLVFVVSLVAFLRWSRGFRRFILRRPQTPTVADDVWLMHQVPQEVDPDDDDLAVDGADGP